MHPKSIEQADKRLKEQKMLGTAAEFEAKTEICGYRHVVLERNK